MTPIRKVQGHKNVSTNKIKPRFYEDELAHSYHSTLKTNYWSANTCNLWAHFLNSCSSVSKLLAATSLALNSLTYGIFLLYLLCAILPIIRLFF